MQSLERGLEIIRSFGRDDPELTVSELAARTGLTRAAVRRFLITLMELGYVEAEGGTYRLTPRVLDLGYSYLSGLSFAEAALPRLERLVAEVGEGSEASILDLPDIVYVARVPSPTTITISINVGARMPSHATAMGHVLLSALPPEAFDRYLAEVTPLQRFQANTITDPDALRAEIGRVREQGYALVDQELEEGLLAVAVLVRQRGDVVGSINLSTHIARRDLPSLRTDLLPPLLRTAQAIEADLAGAGR